MATLKEQYIKKVIPEMKSALGYKNNHAVPKIEKVVVNVGIGKIQDKKEREDVKNAISIITGQKPQERPAKKSIAAFKAREGSIVGYRVTLRGSRMYEFLSKLIWSTIPRMGDFRGIELSNIDESGNLNIGIPEHIIFPETIKLEDISKIFGLQVTIVTNAKSKEEAIELFRRLGFPLKKA